MLAQTPETSTPADRPSNAADRATELLEALRQQFEVLRDFKPLKIGIHLDLIAARPDIDRATLKQALRKHVTRARYLKNLAKGGPRYDLAGQPAGEISEEHRTGRVALKAPPKKSASPPAPAEKPNASPPAPEAPPSRPILRLKPKSGPVAAITITRKVTP